MSGPKVFAVLCAAVGLSVPAQTALAADVFVAPDGSDANACTAAAPCQTFNRAYHVAQLGQTVEVAGGVYGAQTLLAPSSAGAGHVLFQPAPGASVTVNGELRSSVSHTEFRDMTIGDWYLTDRIADVVFRNVSTQAFFTHSNDSVSIIGGSVGGTNNGTHSFIAATDQTTVPSSNILIDGVSFHDVTRTANPTAHVECLFVSSVNGLTIRNSRFTHCDVMDLFVSNFGLAPPPTNLLVENDMLDVTTGGGSYALFFAFSGPGNTVRNNSFAQSIHFDPGTSAAVLGNVGPLGQAQCTAGGSGISWAYDVWDGAQCTFSDRNAPSGYVNQAGFDLHLAPGAAAVDFVPASADPLAVDIDGDARPQGAAVDAGADEAPAGPPPADAPPTVAITAPADGATVSASVTVSANAGDDVGVAGVQFSVDASPLGAEDTTAPYSAVWDTTTASNGTHALRAVARDTAGQTSSASVTVTVDNPPPPPPLAFLVGDQAIEPAVDSNAAGTAEAFLRRAAATGTVTQLNVYVDASSTASTVAVGFYSGGGHPTRLLTQGTIAAPVAGAWNSVTVPAAAVSANTKYWIALLGPRGAGTIRFRDRCCGGGSATETSAQTTLTSLPATWSTGRLFSDGPISAYGAGR